MSNRSKKMPLKPRVSGLSSRERRSYGRVSPRPTLRPLDKGDVDQMESTIPRKDRARAARNAALLFGAMKQIDAAERAENLAACKFGKVVLERFFRQRTDLQTLTVRIRAGRTGRPTLQVGAHTEGTVSAQDFNVITERVLQSEMLEPLKYFNITFVEAQPPSKKVKKSR